MYFLFNFVRQAGCLRFDPIDICGHNPDRVLQSRMEGYAKAMLDELLYQDLAPVDHCDKEMCIFAVENWPCGVPIHEWRHQNGCGYTEPQTVREYLLIAITQQGALSSHDMYIDCRGIETGAPAACQEPGLSNCIIAER